ncbi:MAG: hypothetical protein GY858_01580 [Candidatus Omnitrophica bacterium]|nr:hypothetical protein [Candidatus Omnitrophota bacterium]
MVLDENNNPHIVYSSNEGLKYTFFTGRTWLTQAVEKGRFVGQDPKIALDSQTKPHISYFFYDQKNDIRGLKYASYVDGNWKTMFVDKKGTNGSIAIDSKDRPHITYSVGPGVGHGYWDGNKWQIKTVNAIGDWRQYKELTPRDRFFGRTDVSMVLDSDDNPHIAYFDRLPGDLRYISLINGEWKIEVVDSEGLVGLSPSIAIDEKGIVHITYLQADNCDLKYAYRNKTDWEVYTVDKEKNTGCDSNIKLDRSNKPHILYQRCNDEELKYAFFDGKWNIETIEKRKIGWTTAQSSKISLDLDIDGKPHISCYGNYKKALKYIYKQGDM